MIWATKEAVRLGLPGEAAGVACKGCPPLERLFEQFADGGGELWLCPICVDARDLGDAEKVMNAKIAGATAVWEWAGNDATVFSYFPHDWATEHARAAHSSVPSTPITQEPLARQPRLPHTSARPLSCAGKPLMFCTIAFVLNGRWPITGSATGHSW